MRGYEHLKIPKESFTYLACLGKILVFCFNKKTNMQNNNKNNLLSNFSMLP